MKWIVLPYSEWYFEETKYISVKFYQFSCIQGYYQTNSIRKCVWFVYNFSAFFNMPTFLPNLRLMRPLSFSEVQLVVFGVASCLEKHWTCMKTPPPRFRDLHSSCSGPQCYSMHLFACYNEDCCALNVQNKGTGNSTYRHVEIVMLMNTMIN
mgnify:CR=1 FL=1